MSRPRHQQVALGVGTALSGCGALFLLVRFLQTVSARFSYGFDLEWMEGGMLVHAWRLREGLGLYVEPSADFIPYIYPPLYPWLLSLLGPADYGTGRLLSAVATLAAVGALVALLRRDGTPWLFALGGAAAFLSCYDESGSFYDLVRGDALALGFASWFLVALRMAGPRSVGVAGLLLVAAYLSKHNYALLGLPALYWLWRFHSRDLALRFLAASAGVALMITAGLTLASEGRFLVYLLGVPAVHPFVADRAFPGAGIEMLKAVPWVAGAASVAGVELFFFRHGKEREPVHLEAVAFWVGMAGVVWILCAVMRGHHGGFINVLMPGFWMLSALGARLLGRLWLARPHTILALAMGLLFAVQAWQGAWEAKRYSPTKADVEAGQALLATIAGYEGEVLVPHAPWYPALVGKTPSFPLIALWDVEHPGGPLFRYTRRVRKAFAEQRWDAVIVTRPKKSGRNGLGHGMAKTYERAPSKDLKLKGRAFWSRAGWRVRPTQVWEPLDENESR